MADRVNGWFRREGDPQARPTGLQYPPVPQTTDVAPTDVSSDSWPAARSLSRSASNTSIHSAAAPSAAATDATSEPRHWGTAGGPLNGSQRKRSADDGELLLNLRSTKRNRALRSNAAPAAAGTPWSPLGTEDRLDPRRKRKLSSSGLIPETEPANQTSRRHRPAPIPAMSPPGLKRRNCPDIADEEGQGRHLAKRRKSQQTTARVPATDFPRRLREPRPRKEVATTRSRPGNGRGKDLAQPRKQAVPKPNYQLELRKSARIAALRPKKYR
ncbi:uncharacterized protein F4812DRAFT_218329 [Daldinia caldariorum]|uniref:uncharacterized protein n=1 Tax=Daldinia caldariorum TaxID=326644 RepID=UPI0020073189|nr:uncharacterized protein F4812DRAFT_218329 [Daldinia caldariorum]KAI1463977.1 hypothetical protein F4812DRAFT_218329 [Daldinia caldariorum]